MSEADKLSAVVVERYSEAGVVGNTVFDYSSSQGTCLVEGVAYVKWRYVVAAVAETALG